MSAAPLSMAWKYFKAERCPEAVETALALIAIEPTNHEAFFILGLAKSQLGQHEAAEAAYRRAIELFPNDSRFHFYLGSALGEQERHKEAVKCYERGMTLGDAELDFHRTYSRLLLRIGDFSKAEVELRYIFTKDSTDKLSGYDLARLLKHRQEFSAAADIYQQILTIDSQWREARKHLWNCLLLSGRLREGFAAYEERFSLELVKKRPLPYPTWNGEFSLNLRLFVHAEQGYGDIIQMSRYIPLLAKKGILVTLECPPEISHLLDSVLGLERLIWSGDHLPTDIDAEISIMSLPHCFSTDISTIPADVPYIFPDVERVDKWKEVLGGGFKIGLVWQGNPSFPNDAKRSFPLTAMAPLLALPKIRFFGLQKDHGRENMEEFPAITDLGPHLHNFVETAAIIANLNLLITCDTGLAHLAGAMGKTTWLALPYEPDWRWMINRTDSPWYPTIQLFRQPTEGDWDSVFTMMAMAITG